MDNEQTNTFTAPKLGQVLTHKTPEEYSNDLASIKAKIEDAVKFADESNDWKEVRAKLSDAKDKLVALFLNDADNASFNEIINQTLEKVNQRQLNEKAEFEKESFENYTKAKEVVVAAVESTISMTDFKQAREILINSQNSFKNMKLKRAQRDELFELINKRFEEINQKQADERENYEMECIENFHNAKSKIEAVMETFKANNMFTEARQGLIGVQGFIKDMKLKREQREELYNNIRTHFNTLNTLQSEERASSDTEINANYEQLSKIVNDAITFAQDNENYQDARATLINAQTAIKGMKLRREQRDDLYGKIRTVFDNLNQTQSAEREGFEKECNENYDKLTLKVNDAFDLVHGVEEFNLIRDTLIAVQGEVKIVKLKKEQRNELFSRIREAFNIFDKKRKEYYEKLYAEKIAKLDVIKANIVEKLTKNEELLAKDNEQLAELNNQLTSTPENAEEINVKIKKVEHDITEKTARINENKARLEDIEKEYEKIRTQMSK